MPGQSGRLSPSKSLRERYCGVKSCLEIMTESVEYIHKHMILPYPQLTKRFSTVPRYSKRGIGKGRRAIRVDPPARRPCG